MKALKQIWKWLNPPLDVKIKRNLDKARLVESKARLRKAEAKLSKHDRSIRSNKNYDFEPSFLQTQVSNGKSKKKKDDFGIDPPNIDFGGF